MLKLSARKRLDKIYNEAELIRISDDDRIVIFSDLHLGNGGRNDDFANNAELFQTVIRDYYLKKDFRLILNGDVEELYKFSLNKINKSWGNIFDLFDEFSKASKFNKIIGNHDFELIIKHHSEHKYKLYQSLRLQYKTGDIFIYHGHQTAGILEQYSRFVLYIVRYLLRMFSNDSIPIENGKRYKTEQTAYEYSRANKIISILGHTHRPLFESLSKIERLNFSIELLLKKYNKATEKEKFFIESQLAVYRKELEHLHEKNRDLNLRGSIYDERILMPCLFNSGAVTGKRGMTAIEIKNGKIYLVYWFDKQKSTRYLNNKEFVTKRLGKSDFYRTTLKKENLDYIFSRIKLLCL